MIGVICMIIMLIVALIMLERPVSEFAGVLITVGFVFLCVALIGNNVREEENNIPLKIVDK